MTNNAVMIHCLEEIIKMLQEGKDYNDILPTAQRGLKASRLKKMLDEKELEDG